MLGGRLRNSSWIESVFACVGRGVWIEEWVIDEWKGFYMGADGGIWGWEGSSFVVASFLLFAFGWCMLGNCASNATLCLASGDGKIRDVRCELAD